MYKQINYHTQRSDKNFLKTQENDACNYENH